MSLAKLKISTQAVAVIPVIPGEFLRDPRVPPLALHCHPVTTWDQGGHGFSNIHYQVFFRAPI